MLYELQISPINILYMIPRRKSLLNKNCLRVYYVTLLGQLYCIKGNSR